MSDLANEGIYVCALAAGRGRTEAADANGDARIYIDAFLFQENTVEKALA